MKIITVITFLSAVIGNALADVSPKIVGGVDATEGRFPYFVSLLADLCLLRRNADIEGAVKDANIAATLRAAVDARSSQPCPDLFRFCGGSLISPDAVLTAGHCLLDFGNVIFPSHIRVGDFDDSSAGTGEAVVALNVRHPNFNENTLRNDFMVVRLETPFDSSQPTVTLREEPVDTADATADDLTLTIFGFGLLEKNYEYDGIPPQTTDILQVVDLDLVTDNICTGQYGPTYAKAVMMCAAAPGKDSCQGDSGGPLIIAGGSTDGSEDVQVGVVSFGRGCASPDFAGIYSRVSSALGFIEDALNINITDNEYEPNGVGPSAVLMSVAVLISVSILLMI